jgi:hypothetical protein
MLINLILYLNFFAIFLKLIIRIAFYLSILINLIFFAKKIFMFMQDEILKVCTNQCYSFWVCSFPDVFYVPLMSSMRYKS